MKMTLEFKVLGFQQRTQKKDNIEIEYTQLQTYQMINGRLKKHTLKINQKLTDKQLGEIIDKTIICNSEEDELKEFGDYDKVYMANSYKLAPKELKNLSLKVNNSVRLQITNVLLKENDTIIQSLAKKGNSIELIDIKIKDRHLDVKEFINKEVDIDDIKVVNFNFKTYYSTNTLPKII